MIELFRATEDRLCLCKAASRLVPDPGNPTWLRIPERLMELTASSDSDQARLAMEAMMTMQKIDIAALEAAMAT